VNDDGVLPDARFGAGDVKPIDWRNVPDEADADDEELTKTPADVVGLLGFDPKDAD
jgi:hypothetical protein